jgi:acetyl esterase/lipase
VAHYGRPILERGGIFVSLGYRLAPEVRFPDTVEDVELGLARLASYVLEKGGDTDRVHLSGHSAGAALAAFAALRPSTKETEALQGLVLVSGMYDFSVQSDEVGNHLSRRYVPDLTQAIEHVPAHVIVVIGDRDLPAVPPAATAMLNALHAKGTPVDSFVEKNADHFEAIRGFASSSSAVASSVASMMGL